MKQLKKINTEIGILYFKRTIFKKKKYGKIYDQNKKYFTCIKNKNQYKQLKEIKSLWELENKKIVYRIMYAYSKAELIKEFNFYYRQFNMDLFMKENYAIKHRLIHQIGEIYFIVNYDRL